MVSWPKAKLEPTAPPNETFPLPLDTVKVSPPKLTSAASMVEANVTGEFVVVRVKDRPLRSAKRVTAPP